jgi:FtsP/CotA-like multicopper oxidase with cupredoxin domain
MDEMVWKLNGRTFELEEVASDERFQLNGLYIWEFVNLPGRGMMADFMAHPMHIHGVQFQVLSRQIDPQYAEAWQTLADGIIDEGWHDTVLVAPGERVQVIMRLTEPGLFLYHCHILEHEDGGMMRNFLVEA